MQKISTHLWFDTQAKEAAAFYVSVFKDAQIKNTAILQNTPSGTVDLLDVSLLGQDFTLISAGPLFTFNPSISFLVACKTEAEVDELWNKLFEGGKALMELGSYPFSQRYGWLQDKYGLSWQIMYFGDIPIGRSITPMLLFVGEQCGRAEEAINFYTSIFKDSKVDIILRHTEEDAPDAAGTVKLATFTLEGEAFNVMDSAHKHAFAFNEAVSFVVRCDTQEEIDYYWSKLSAVPEAEQCGWLKDQFGVSWQVVPTVMDEMMQTKDQAKIDRLTQAFLKMKRFDIATLREVYERTESVGPGSV